MTLQTTISITVEGQTPPLSASISYSPSDIVETGQSFTVSVNPSGGCGGYTYLWGDGYTGQSQTFTENSVGTYSGHVTVTDSCGNSVTVDWSVTVESPPPQFTSTTGCYKTASGYTDVELSATWEYGEGPFSWVYTWSDGTQQTGSDSSSSGGTASTSRSFPESSAEFSADLTVTDSLGRQISTTVSATTICS